MPDVYQPSYSVEHQMELEPRLEHSCIPQQAGGFAFNFSLNEDRSVICSALNAEHKVILFATVDLIRNLFFQIMRFAVGVHLYG